MAHVGKTYPWLFYRDYSAPQSGFAKRLAWRYAMTGGIAPPGPFAGWANKLIISDEPFFADSKREVHYLFQPPAGADATTQVLLRYRLSYDANFFEIFEEALIGGVSGLTTRCTTFATDLSDIIEQVSSRIIHSPPWPAVPSFGIIGRYRGATWSQLGVDDYPGFPFT